MIQYPLPGELVVEVPKIGPLILDKPFDYLNRAFGGCLARGRRVGPGNPGVEWIVDPYTKCGDGDPACASKVAELRRTAAAVIVAAGELQGLAKAAGRDSGTVRVPGAVLASIGRAIDQEHASIPRDTVILLAEVLRRGALGVRRAADRGDILEHDGRLLVYGWCFLPPTAEIDEVVAPSVGLEYQDELALDRPGAQRLTWSVRGDAESISLVRVSATDDSIEGTEVDLRAGQRSGFWRFPGRELKGGQQYVAKARWSGGVAFSNPTIVPAVRVPDPPTPPSAPPPPVDTRWDSRVQLDYVYDGPDSTTASQRMRWSVDSDADTIVLVRRDGTEFELAETHTPLVPGSREGEWVFADGFLPGGARYVARARRGPNVLESGEVIIPKRRSWCRQCGRRWCIACRRWFSWRWLLAALLLLLALGLLLLLLTSLRACDPGGWTWWPTSVPGGDTGRTSADRSPKVAPVVVGPAGGSGSVGATGQGGILVDSGGAGGVKGPGTDVVAGGGTCASPDATPSTPTESGSSGAGASPTSETKPLGGLGGGTAGSGSGSDRPLKVVDPRVRSGSKTGKGVSPGTPAPSGDAPKSGSPGVGKPGAGGESP